MRKGIISHISEFSFKDTYNLESIAATDFNFGVTILTSSCSTRKEFHTTPPPVWEGRACKSIVFENHHFTPHLGSSPLSTGGLL